MELFRGYVPTRNKQCLEKFKGVEKLKTRSEVQDLDEYAGILGEETILIDVDDAELQHINNYQLCNGSGFRTEVQSVRHHTGKTLLVQELWC